MGICGQFQSSIFAMAQEGGCRFNSGLRDSTQALNVSPKGEQSIGDIC